MVAPNYRSLVGGFFSSNPHSTTVKRTIRTNNPWALNISEWQKSYPGYVGFTQPDNSPNANKTTIYETPEQGVAAGYDLLRRYAAGGHDTVQEIINRYGGGQNYSAYLDFVLKRTGFSASTHINLQNDAQLLTLAKAMFRYEAGQEIPWTDQQIIYGIKLGREYAGGAKAPAPASTPQVPVAKTEISQPTESWLSVLIRAILSILGLGKKQLKFDRILRLGDVSNKGGDVWQLQEKLRELGFVDIVVDGEFGKITDRAVRSFQLRENLDPDGEVGELTLRSLNRAQPGAAPKPELMPPPAVTGGRPNTKPSWYVEAEKDIGWKEQGSNRGITYFIADTRPKTGKEGDPYCAIGINAWLGRAGLEGSGSAMARSFERQPSRFKKLTEPSLGCIVTMWRISPSSGSGHVFLYDGESTKGVRGIGANEDNMVKRSFHDRARITGYWWPIAAPAPTGGRIMVSDDGTVVTRSEV